ncbi:MAG: ABC transporter ATP-binding protein [Flavobacteriales bacterium]|jgi:lipoprotein-releasing system ATP-binding protein
MIILENIHKSFGQTHVLKGITASISKGDFITISGASGAGKSTLLHLIAGLDQCSQGSITFEGKAISSLSKTARNQWRNQRVGLVFQFHNLLPELNALDNVMVPSWLGKQKDDQVEARAKELLERLGVGHRLHHYPSELSGGEQQRVAIARALMNAPDVLLADEPTGNLDSKNADEVHAILKELNEKHGQTVVVVTHNKSLAALGKTKWTMRDGMLA